MIFSAKRTKRWLLVIAMAPALLMAQDHEWRVSGEASAPMATMQQTRPLAGVFDAQGKAIPHTLHCQVAVDVSGSRVLVTQTETNKLIPGIPFVSANQVISGHVVFEYTRAAGETVTNSYGEVQPAAYRLHVSGSGMTPATFLRRERDFTWGNVLAGEVIAERNSFCLNKLKYLETKTPGWKLFNDFFQKLGWAVY